eukprot:365808-Chlamydomonas_euryale.AAC.31
MPACLPGPVISIEEHLGCIARTCRLPKSATCNTADLAAACPASAGLATCPPSPPPHHHVTVMLDFL